MKQKDLFRNTSNIPVVRILNKVFKLIRTFRNHCGSEYRIKTLKMLGSCTF